MTEGSKIKLCYPCGFFRPGDEEDPIAGEYEQIDGVIWPKTAGQFWDKLKAVPREAVAEFSGGALSENGSIKVPCLGESWVVNPGDGTVRRVDETKGSPDSEWDGQIPFLLLVYLASVRKDPATYDMAVPRDLFKGVDIFRNGLQTALCSVEETFGNDGENFLDVAKRLGGNQIQGGDVAVRFHIFSEVPGGLYPLAWRRRISCRLDPPGRPGLTASSYCGCHRSGTEPVEPPYVSGSVFRVPRGIAEKSSGKNPRSGWQGGDSDSRRI